MQKSQFKTLSTLGWHTLKKWSSFMMTDVGLRNIISHWELDRTKFVGRVHLFGNNKSTNGIHKHVHTLGVINNFSFYVKSSQTAKYDFLTMVDFRGALWHPEVGSLPICKLQTTLVSHWVFSQGWDIDVTNVIIINSILELKTITSCNTWLLYECGSVSYGFKKAGWTNKYGEQCLRNRYHEQCLM